MSRMAKRMPCCRFRKGRQEDAHEYLMTLLDAMHESMVRSTHGKRPAPDDLQPSSLIHRIFGGRIRNQVSISSGPC